MLHFNFDNIQISPEHCVIGFGTTLIVAPHADDESLGCGGVISLLRKYGQTVYIVLLSDGTLSHPNSKEYPADKLRDLREKELVNAAGILGVSAENIFFCRYTDRNVPSRNEEEFEKAVENISTMLDMLQPQTIFVPWRRDPHPDHKAAFQILSAATTPGITIYEYPIWLQELGKAADRPTSDESMAFCLDITTVLAKKQEAIAQHRSQITDLISDDPGGFRLAKEMLSQFNVPYETFYITKQ
ncbi:PIG-L deacetylase family protein [Sphingobacterium kitahiroshimense]|uniref:PIG-L deacetylase family protein n=1 Tax=Sphingobacterium kitahiroshimense TaxID=470446 RepID=A0ABV0C1R0_9SPHI